MAIAGWQYFTTQKQWESYLKDLLKTNDNTLLKAIVLIYDNQTEEEKSKGESVEDNNIGFTKWDAKEMGDIARKIKRGEPLTIGELAKSRNKMQKYWKQLMYISKHQQEEKAKAEALELEKKLAEEARLAEVEDKKGREQFKQHNEMLRRCAEEGIACDYGICDECPVTQGFQMRMTF